MEENTTNENNENVSKEATKTVKESKKSSKKDENKGPGFFAKHKAEFKKIKWPTREDLIKETVVVIIISLAVGAIIFGMDTVFKFGFTKLIDLISL